MIHNRDITRHPVHITLRLYNSIPRAKLEELEAAYERELDRAQTEFARDFPNPTEADYQKLRTTFQKLIAAKFIRQDYYLDKCGTGPAFLAQPDAKKIILDSWHHLAKKHDLHIYAISVMSNHFHILLATRETPATRELCSPVENPGKRSAPHVVSFPQLLQAFKRFTAAALNRLHQQKGRRVWPDKAFDRDIRPGTFHRVMWYILNNPVKAGLTTEPLTWFENYYDAESLRLPERFALRQ